MLEITQKVNSWDEIRTQSTSFELKLKEKKTSLREESFWYPYSSMANFTHLDLLFNEDQTFFQRMNHIAEIGCADGDVGFFLESLGYKIDMIDFEQPNFNKLEGARTLHKELASKNEIYNVDLDSQFKLPHEKYDLILFLGILYHLKNPYYILERLAYASKYLVLSTRVARTTKDNSCHFKDVPVAYLADADDYENGDSTNYWIFSEAGLKRICNRTQWNVVRFVTVGNQENSDPSSTDRDERAFCLLESRAFM